MAGPMRASWKSIQHRRPSWDIRLRLWKSRWHRTRGHDADLGGEPVEAVRDRRPVLDREVALPVGLQEVLPEEVQLHDSFSKSKATWKHTARWWALAASRCSTTSWSRASAVQLLLPGGARALQRLLEREVPRSCNKRMPSEPSPSRISGTGSPIPP